MPDYTVFGLTLRSSFPFCELPELDSLPGEPDIIVKQGHVPEYLDDATRRTSVHDVRGSEDHILRLPGIIRLRIQNGRKITAHPLATEDDISKQTEQASSEDWRIFVLGSGFASICHQRGLLPLHASAVCLPDTLGGGALVLIGHTTVGKSTLAAALTNAGLSLIADDLCVVDFSDHGPVALPGPGRLKLHRDSLDALGWVGTQRVRPNLNKFSMPPASDLCREAVPIRACILLEEARSSRPLGLVRATGADAFSALVHHVHRRRSAQLMGLRQPIFTSVARLCGNVPVLQLSFDRCLEHLAETADLVMRAGTDPTQWQSTAL